MPKKLTTRFDPEAGASYGTCLVCNQTISDDAASSRHLQAFDDHRVQVTNRPRERRIQSFVGQEFERAIESVLWDLSELLPQDGQDGDYTVAELKAAIEMIPLDDIVTASIEQDDMFDDDEDDDVADPLENQRPVVSEDQLTLPGLSSEGTRA